MVEPKPFVPEPNEPLLAQMAPGLEQCSVCTRWVKVYKNMCPWCYIGDLRWKLADLRDENMNLRIASSDLREELRKLKQSSDLQRPASCAVCGRDGLLVAGECSNCRH